jgi:plastocyanin
MTWLSRICFSAALLAQAVAATTVGGTVQLVDSRDANVRRKSDYSGVVVWMERVGAPQPAASAKTVRIVQKAKRFVPHVTAIPVGATVDFPNLDPIFHNAFSNFAGQPFDVGLYAPGTSQRVRFVREGVVRVFCNIHPTMSAVIVVAPTPHLAVSAKGGEFSIQGVEPGEYRLRVFHERASEQTLRALERKVMVERSLVTLPPITVSESGYIEAPHKNKYGKDYPPVIEDRAIYPPGRNL